MTLNEVAPPTKKHERMVKHIKKAYKKDGKLTDDEKSIAYATAWKNYNKKNEKESIKKFHQLKNYKKYFLKKFVCPFSFFAFSKSKTGLSKFLSFEAKSKLKLSE